MSKSMTFLALMLTSFFSLSVHAIVDFKDWDGAGEVVLENTGDGHGLRYKLPIDALKAGQTFRFEKLEGDYQFITVYVEYTERDMTLNKGAYYPNRPINFIDKNIMKDLLSFQKKQEGYTNTHYIISLNGHADDFQKAPGKVKMSLGDYPAGAGSKPFGAWIMDLYYYLYIGYFFYMLMLLFKKVNTMLHDKSIPNTQISGFAQMWGIGNFLASIFLGLMVPMLLSKALFGGRPSGGGNFGFLMLCFAAGSIGAWFYSVRNLLPNRCPNCNHYGNDIKVIGTSNHTDHTRTTYKDGKVDSVMNYETYAEHRECPDCGHRWARGRIK